MVTSNSHSNMPVKSMLHDLSVSQRLQFVNINMNISVQQLTFKLSALKKVVVLAMSI